MWCMFIHVFRKNSVAETFFLHSSYNNVDPEISKPYKPIDEDEEK